MTGHNRFIRRAFVVAAVAVLATATGTVPQPVSASEPAQQTVRLTTSPGVVEYKWTGTIPPGATGASAYGTDACVNNPTLEDIHTIKIQHAASRIYKKVSIDFAFTIRWEPAVNDNALTVFGPAGALIHSDGGEPSETVRLNNLDEADYKVIGCPFASPVPSEYTGTLVITTTLRPQAKSTATTTPPAAGRPNGASGSGTTRPGSSGGLPFAPNAPAITTPSARPAPGTSGFTPALTEEGESEAAPSAFRGSADDVAQQAPPALETKAVDATKVPLALVVGTILAGLAAGAFGLVVRRRRQLDTPPPPGTAVVPVTS